MKPENIDETDNRIISIVDQHPQSGIRMYEIHTEINKPEPNTEYKHVPMSTLRTRILRLERLEKITILREWNVLRCFPYKEKKEAK